MIRSQEASTLEWDASSLEYLNIGANSETARNTRTIFYGFRLPHIGPEQYSCRSENSLWLMGLDFVLENVHLTRQNVQSGPVCALCDYSMFSVISSLALSGKNRLCAWATWSAMHRGHLFFSYSDQAFHPCKCRLGEPCPRYRCRGVDRSVPTSTKFTTCGGSEYAIGM